jgi:hypothetical protein
VSTAPFFWAHLPPATSVFLHVVHGSAVCPFPHVHTTDVKEDVCLKRLLIPLLCRVVGLEAPCLCYRQRVAESEQGHGEHGISELVSTSLPWLPQLNWRQVITLFEGAAGRLEPAVSAAGGGRCRLQATCRRHS